MLGEAKAIQSTSKNTHPICMQTCGLTYSTTVVRGPRSYKLQITRVELEILASNLQALNLKPYILHTQTRNTEPKF